MRAGLSFFLGTLVALSLLMSARFAPAQRTPVVEVADVQLRELAPTITLPGTVISRDDSQLAAMVGGLILTIAEVGDAVVAGQALTSMDEVNLRLAKVENENLVASESSRISFLQSDVKRLTQLAAQNIGAKSQLEQSESNLAIARSDKRAAQARLDRIEADLVRTTTPALFDGIVTERFVNPGEIVAPGAPILRLVGMSRLEVTARAPVRSVRYLNEGDALNVRNQYNQTVGTLRTKVPAGDSRAHMYDLRIAVGADQFSVNEDVRVEIPTADSNAQLVVPRDALVLRRERTIVYRISAEMTAEAVVVKPGAARGDLIGVAGDLQAGDQVIVRGAERLQPGANVQIVTPAGGKAGLDAGP